MTREAQVTQVAGIIVDYLQADIAGDASFADVQAKNAQGWSFETLTSDAVANRNGNYLRWEGVRLSERELREAWERAVRFQVALDRGQGYVEL